MYTLELRLQGEHKRNCYSISVLCSIVIDTWASILGGMGGYIPPLVLGRGGWSILSSPPLEMNEHEFHANL